MNFEGNQINDIFIAILTLITLGVSLYYNANKLKFKTQVKSKQTKNKTTLSSKQQPNEEHNYLPINFIGYLKSPYKTRFGCPRQAGLVPNSKGIIIINKELQPESILDGLNTFSHIWVIFYFHQNTNLNILRKKIRVPRLDNKKLGIYSTRSPHRPNPIGLSLVKLDKIQQNKLFVSGINLLDSTPILDIKPYIPIDGYDIVKPLNMVKIPKWVTNKAYKMIENVYWDSNATKWLIKNQAYSKDLFQSIDEFKLFVEQTLSTDIRTPRDRINDSKNKHDGKYCVNLDLVMIRFEMRQLDAYITSIEWF